MNPFFQKIRGDIGGVFWLSAGTFLALTLSSFTPTDPSFNSIGQGLKVHNYCGYFGSFLGDALYQLWGLTAWVLVALCFQLAWQTFMGRGLKASRERWLWMAGAMLTSSSLLALYFPNVHRFGGHIAVGGLIGIMVTKVLVTVFNFVGVAVILWSTLAMLLISANKRSVREWLGLLSSWITSSYRQLGKRMQETRKASVITIAKEKPMARVLEAEPAAVDQESRNEAEAVQPLVQKSLFEFRRERESRKTEKFEPRQVERIENWTLPHLDLLEDRPVTRTRLDEKEIQRKSDLLVDKLQQFAVNGEIVGIKPGPAVTMFEFKPNADVKISKITELADDLSLALSSESVRIIAPIPGRDVVGIETSNAKRELVYLKDILDNEKFWDEKMKLPLAMGREANGETKVVDLRKMPHLLVAGTTGSGKSVFVVSTITGLLFKHSPKTLRLILIDPKQVDLAAFNQVPHLLMPPIREAKKAVSALRWAIREMDKRYRSMSRFGARGIEGFNETVGKLTSDQLAEHQKRNEDYENQGAMKLEQYYYTPQPYIVIVVEEFGDLMAVDKVNVEQAVVRLAQMARACGIHLVLAMQSPRKDVVTGLIKTNIPGRISFKVASKMDSRIILDEGGAERLLAQGDMLFLAPGVAKPQRHHGPWVTEDEIASVMRFWSSQGEPDFDRFAMQVLDGSGGGYEFASDSVEDEGEASQDDADMDAMYDHVLEFVSTMKEVSASLLQRKFRLGYPRAARLIEIFEREGVVGPANGSKPRAVLINNFAEKD